MACALCVVSCTLLVSILVQGLEFQWETAPCPGIALGILAISQLIDNPTLGVSPVRSAIERSGGWSDSVMLQGSDTGAVCVRSSTAGCVCDVYCLCLCGFGCL